MNAGLCIQILSPSPGQHVAAGSDVDVQVLVALACGCPSGAGGRFDFRRFEVRGSLIGPDGADISLALAPRATGIFAGRLTARPAGRWRINIEAYDPESGRAGRTGIEFKSG